MSHDLDGMEVFVAVAEAKGFRAAGERLGATGSAVSQALSSLEARLGLALVQRTTRSVRLTEALGSSSTPPRGQRSKNSGPPSLRWASAARNRGARYAFSWRPQPRR